MTFKRNHMKWGVIAVGLGNILLFAIGKGFYPVQEFRKPNSCHSWVLPSLRDEDFSLYSRNRIMNLRRLFPYIPESLDSMLMHFAQGTEVFYETTGEPLEDLRGGLRDLPQSETDSTSARPLSTW